ncbi:hypothetical protein CFC21_019293 [Triticum aestivum]|uniref:Growth-regulating factor n=2 Tax=Triticum aestivum TaxID=4565 RepID=A0A9R1E6F1_WHEAT|nr:hypothetical protein CFC21_019293 [Triticum aestivum]
MCENKEPKILENDHKIDSGFSDLVIMEVDGTWSTVGIQSHKALDLDKSSSMAATSSPRPSFSSPWMNLNWKQQAISREGILKSPHFQSMDSIHKDQDDDDQEGRSPRPTPTTAVPFVCRRRPQPPSL